MQGGTHQEAERIHCEVDNHGKPAGKTGYRP